MKKENMDKKVQAAARDAQAKLQQAASLAKEELLARYGSSVTGLTQ